MFNKYFFKLSSLALTLLALPFILAPLANAANFGMMPLPTKSINTIVVTTTADILHPADGKCSLREAVISANTNPPLDELQAAGECQKGRDTITDRIVLLSGETYFLTLVGSGEDGSQTGDLDLANNSAEHDLEFVVSGDETNRPMIDATGLGDRIFEIGDPTVSFRHIIIQNSTATLAGNGIYNHSGTVNLEDTFIRYMEGNVGAGIFNVAGIVSLTDGSTILWNEATVGEGGGIFNGPDGQIHLNRAFIDSNIALDGGGIFNQGTLTVDNDSRAFNNTATRDGGGIYNFGGVVSGPKLRVESNKSALRGAGIMNTNNGEIDLKNLLLITNRADDSGSGIYNDFGSRLKINASDIHNNLDNSGIYNKGDLTLVDTQVSKNVEGGIVSQGGQIMLLRTQVHENTGTGGIRLTSGAKATIYQSAIYDNSANISGGGIYMTGSSLEMANSTVSGNRTEIGIGGGVHFHSGFEGESVRFYNVTIAENVAKSNTGSALSFVSKTIDIEMVNTILTGPEGQTVCHNGTVKSNGNNIVSDESCLAVLESGDQIISPLLKALDSIDGMMGHLPELTSPAFGNASSTACAAPPVSNIDQRGLAREYGCDIGAMELLQAPPPAATLTPAPGGTPVVTVTPVPSGTPDPGAGEKSHHLFLPLVVRD